MNFPREHLISGFFPSCTSWTKILGRKGQECINSECETNISSVVPKQNHPLQNSFFLLLRNAKTHRVTDTLAGCQKNVDLFDTISANELDRPRNDLFLNTSYVHFFWKITFIFGWDIFDICFSVRSFMPEAFALRRSRMRHSWLLHFIASTLQ